MKPLSFLPRGERRAGNFRRVAVGLFASWSGFFSFAVSGAIQEGARLSYQVTVLEPGGNWLDLSRQISGVVQSEIHLYPGEWEGQSVVRYDKEDRLVDGAKVSWSFILDHQRLSLLRLERKVLNSSGRLTSHTWHDYREVGFSPQVDLCYMYTIPVWLMAQEMKIGARYEFQILLAPDGSPLPMSAKVTGQETITVPAGTFPCWKVVLEPDLKKILGRWSWVSPIISPWVPDYHFWLKQIPPHFQVRFQGRFGPVGAAPLQTYDLLRLVHPAAE